MNHRPIGPDLAGGRPGPSGVFGISERDWLSNYRVLKIEGFGGRPPVGGGPEARDPLRPPLHPALPANAWRLACVGVRDVCASASGDDQRGFHSVQRAELLQSTRPGLHRKTQVCCLCMHAL